MKNILLFILLLPFIVNSQNLRKWSSDSSQNTLYGDWYYRNLTVGSVPFIGTSKLITQDNANLFWDNTNKALGVGTNTPNSFASIHLHKAQDNNTSLLVTNNSTEDGAIASVRAGLNISNVNTDYITMTILGTNFPSFGDIKARTTIFEGNGSNMLISQLHDTEPMQFLTTSGRLERMRITAAGNVGIGTTSPLTLLHVNKEVGSQTEIFLSNASIESKSSSFFKASTSTTQDTTDYAAIGVLGINYSDVNYPLLTPKSTLIEGMGGNVIVSGKHDTANIIFTTDSLRVERMRIANSGAITFGTGSNSYTFPTTRGSAGQILTDASGTGVVTWASPSSGISTLNTLTASTQTFATGTSGTDFNISSSTSTHTFNIPSASTSNRGLVTTTTQTFAGEKTFGNGAIVTFPSAGSGTSLVVSGDRSLAAPPGISGIGMQLASFTYTNSSGAGTESGGQNFHLINTPTLTSSNAISYTGDVATLKLVGAPIAAGSTTISHPYNILANDVNKLVGIAVGLNEQAAGATIGNAAFNVYTGTGGDTFTLPALATHPGKVYFIKNAGSGNLTVSRAGSDNLYDTSSVTTITVAAGADVIIIAGSSFWYVQN